MFLKAQQHCIGDYRNQRGIKKLARKQGPNSTQKLRFLSEIKEYTKLQIGRNEIKITIKISLFLLAFAKEYFY